MLIFITGGARSGKSAFAEQYAAKLGRQGVYIATAQLYDDEMRERARLHREQRQASGFGWVTREEPYALTELIADYSREAALTVEFTTQTDQTDQTHQTHQTDQTDEVHQTDQTDEVHQTDQKLSSPILTPPSPVLLVDCLTLWLSNWLLRLEPEGRFEELSTKIDELVEVCLACPLPLITVSNEVGSGIVPEYPLGRLFRDYAGVLNRKLAAESRQALLLTAGIPLDLKKLAFSLEEDHL